MHDCMNGPFLFGISTRGLSLCQEIPHGGPECWKIAHGWSVCMSHRVDLCGRNHWWARCSNIGAAEYLRARAASLTLPPLKGPPR
jgi:hypothetical protein